MKLNAIFILEKKASDYVSLVFYGRLHGSLFEI